VRIIFLDSAPLGLISNPKATPINEECRLWLRSILASGAEVIVPEIADYEVRRELLRGQMFAGINRLDALKRLRGITYLPLTTEAMLLAAGFWATARQQGRPSADDKALDGDVILAAQTRSYARPDDDVVVATVNAAHFRLFVPADDWQYIQAG
jgi:hypothetical protein